MSPEQQYIENNLAGFLQTNTDWSETEAREELSDIYREMNSDCPEDQLSDGWWLAAVADIPDDEDFEDSDDSDMIWSVYSEDCESGDCDCCDTDEDASRWGY